MVGKCELLKSETIYIAFQRKVIFQNSYALKNMESTPFYGILKGSKQCKCMWLGRKIVKAGQNELRCSHYLMSNFALGNLGNVKACGRAGYGVGREF